MPADLIIEDAYRPFPKQLLAHQSPARHLLFGGALGPGKSRFLVQHLYATMLRYPGVRCLLGRVHLIDLQRTTEQEWLKVVDNRLFDRRFGGYHNSNTHLYRFPNGAELYMTSLANIDSWLSAELAKVGVDELREWEQEKYNALDARIRWTTGVGTCEREACASLPNAREHSTHPIYQMVSATNPGPGWVKERWYDRWKNGTLPPSHEFIQALTRDNPALPPDYEHSLQETNNPVWVRRMLEGDWTAFEGATFTNFSRGTHVWKDIEPFTHQIERVYGGIDWGATTTYAHRTAAYLTARLKNGHSLTFWEYSKQGPATTDFFETLRAVNKQWKVSAWFADASQYNASRLLRDEGLPFYDAPRHQGARQDGVNLLHRLFEFLPDAQPQLMIHERCTRLISGIETYHEVPESIAKAGYGAVQADPERRDDDEVDALRYNIMGMHKLRPFANDLPIQVNRGESNSRKETASNLMQYRRNEKRDRLREAVAKFDRDDAKKEALAMRDVGRG